MIENLVYSFSCIALLLTLYFSSKEDLKYHRISKKYVIICFIIVMIYNNITGGTVEKTVSFIMTLGIFAGITFFSKGRFGFGDTLVLSALGWFIGDMIHLQYFFVTLGFCMLIVGSYFVLQNHKQNHKGWKKLVNDKMFVPIDKLKPGMVLANDYFMRGLTEKEIEKMKKTRDSPVCIKQTYPFIPIIFLAFLLYVIISFATIYL